jgi:hydroxymethylglutaryl-CoA reductase (NADPH)
LTTYDQKHTNSVVPTHTTEGRSDPTPLPPVPALPAPGAEADAPGTPEPVERRSDVEPCRSLEECLQVFNSGPDGVRQLNNEEVILLAQQGKIAAYALEKVLGDLERAVLVRRALICKPSLPERV